ncbi:hypothetical protein CDCA_CDCA05G1580 [Cyanidium caldarium]|uniref:Uncharacterized protein n=1 Tax=Cyanidium caldarium TaxID=2771 RepID=A0AAV9ITX8_CYACA|nr:hypothetical protein CDCA_CDCA05G1580 [Cyanidium caldarium]
MGVPRFFRWLASRYPTINESLEGEHEFDNFYLDMNGIIHSCTHANDEELVALDEVEMFSRIFAYTERLYRIVRPRRLLYLAVDGVAPRAKMNQQRSRRFRSAKEAERLMAEAIERGEEVGYDESVGPRFDSNCITPGTAFMYRLSRAFKEWIEHKLRNDVAWKTGCDVIFSGPEVPGEGEHKIMEFIRELRAKREPDELPLRHCMYGLDADLIMLGLVTHEPYFTLLREKVLVRASSQESLGVAFRLAPRKPGGSRGAPTSSSPAAGERALAAARMGLPGAPPPEQDWDEFHLLHVGRLRDELLREVSYRPRGDPPIHLDLERVVDDFVFMCVLVGNDFLPHLPHLDISDGAVMLMLQAYRELLPQMGGYLTARHRVHPQRLEMFLARIGEEEVPYFERRGIEGQVAEYRDRYLYRVHYYRTKMGIEVTSADGEERLRKEVIQAYVEGLHWVLQYYHNGCPSWTWFYPHYFAPLCSDLRRLAEYRVRFMKGRPFRPLTQLLGVLPPESSAELPQPYRQLMLDAASPVRDFYPSEFEVDPNGKRNAWEAVVLLPFIDERRLLSAVNAIDPDIELTVEERLRDTIGQHTVFEARSGTYYDEPVAFRSVDWSKVPLASEQRAAFPKTLAELEATTPTKTTTAAKVPTNAASRSPPRTSSTPSRAGRAAPQRHGMDAPTRPRPSWAARAASRGPVLRDSVPSVTPRRGPHSAGAPGEAVDSGGTRRVPRAPSQPSSSSSSSRPPPGESSSRARRPPTYRSSSSSSSSSSSPCRTPRRPPTSRPSSPPPPPPEAPAD